MGVLDANLGLASSKRSQIKAGADELYSLVNSIGSAVDELRPYLKGSVTESSYQKLADNINELKSLKSFVDSYGSTAGGVISNIRQAIEEIKNK